MGMAMSKQIFPSGFNEDLQDFLNLIPYEVVSNVLDNITKNPEFQEVIKYMNSDEFKNFIQTTEHRPDFIGMLIFMQASGLDVYKLVNTIHDLLEIDPLPVPPENLLNVGGREIAEYIATKNHGIVYIDFEEKLNNIPELKALNDHIQGQEFQNKLLSLSNLPVYQQIKQKLHDYGIDVDKIVNIVKDSFYLNTGNAMHRQGPSEELLHHIENYAKKYFKHEDEIVNIDLENVPFQEVIEYVKSDHFKKIILTLNKVPAYIETLNYVQAFGLDVYRVVNTLHEIMKLDPLPVPPKYGVNSLSSRLDKIVISMPCEQFKALFDQKLKTNPELKDFYDHICGEEFQRIVQSIINQPWYPYMKKAVCDVGIDIDKIVYITKALFGLNTAELQVPTLRQYVQRFARLQVLRLDRRYTYPSRSPPPDPS